jgi:hypothetical protein
MAAALTFQSLSGPASARQSDPAGAANPAGANATRKNDPGDLKGRIDSDSLWGNLLLDMVYQRDPVLKELARRKKRIDPVTAVAVTGILGLNTAIGAYTISRGWARTPPLPNRAGGRHRFVIPGSMTMAAGILSALTLGGLVAWFGIYNRKIRARQVVLRESVDALLDRLNQEGETPEIREAFATLVGDRAADEFLQLFKATRRSVL